MITIAVEQFKGGVGKTITADNFACELALRGFKVLLIDNDHQGNTSTYYKRYDKDSVGTHTMLTNLNVNMDELIQHTDFENLDIITTNLKMVQADKDINNEDGLVPREVRYRMALEKVQDRYDYCIFDNAPTLTTSVVNSLCAARDIIVPVEADNFVRTGLGDLTDKLDLIKVYQNKGLNKAYVLFTNVNSAKVTSQGIDKFKEALSSNTNSLLDYVVFESQIKKDCKVVESTFVRMPVVLYKPKCNASIGYKAAVDEYLSLSNQKE